MTYEEKGVWIYVVAVLGTYGTYASIILSQLGTTQITDIDYVWPLVWSIGISILASIILRIVVEIVAPSDKHRADTRDREIDRKGERAGSCLIITGAVGALALALLQAEYFWIANAIYLGFAASAVLASVVKIVTYRRGF